MKKSLGKYVEILLYIDSIQISALLSVDLFALYFIVCLIWFKFVLDEGIEIDNIA